MAKFSMNQWKDYAEKANHQGKRYCSKLMRHCPHMNSIRKAENSFRNDAEEAKEYTSSFSTLRHGKSNGYVENYYYGIVKDVPKHIVKPKKSDHKGKASIRKLYDPVAEEEQILAEESILSAMS